MLKSFLSLIVFWLGILAFTGNLLKLYDNPYASELCEETDQTDDDSETEEDSKEEKVKESEQYLLGNFYMVDTAPVLTNKSKITLHQFSIRQGYSSQLIKPPLS